MKRRGDARKNRSDSRESRISGLERDREAEHDPSVAQRSRTVGVLFGDSEKTPSFWVDQIDAQAPRERRTDGRA